VSKRFRQASFGQVTAGRRERRATEPLFDQARAGLKVAASQPLGGVPILMLVIFNVGYSGATYVGLPALARLEFGAGAQGVGLLLGSLGAGALLGAVTMLLISSIPRVGRFACLAIATVGLGLVGAGMASSLWTVATYLAVAGLGISCAAVALLTIVQVHAPVEMRGRVLALWSLAFTGLTPVSYAAGSWVNGWEHMELFCWAAYASWVRLGSACTRGPCVNWLKEARGRAWSRPPRARLIRAAGHPHCESAAGVSSLGPWGFAWLVPQCGCHLEACIGRIRATRSLWLIRPPRERCVLTRSRIAGRARHDEVCR